MKYSDFVKKVSEELNIPIEVVETAYKSYWVFIRQTIQELPLKDNITEEEFLKLRTNFNIPSLGKLSCTYDKLDKVKRRFNYINKLRHAKNQKD